MPNVIEADLPPLPEPSFKTPQEAIAFAITGDRARGRCDIEQCVGQEIIAATWNSKTIQLHLRNGKRLSLECHPDTIEITVTEVDTGQSLAMARCDDIVTIHAAGTQWTWNRGGLLAGLLGRHFRGLSTGRVLIWVYVADFGILRVSQLIDRRSGQLFLYWDQDD